MSIVRCSLAVFGARWARGPFMQRVGDFRVGTLNVLYPPPSNYGVEWLAKYHGTLGMTSDAVVTHGGSSDYWVKYEFNTIDSPPSGVLKRIGTEYPMLFFHLEFESDEINGVIDVYDGHYDRVDIKEDDAEAQALAEIASLEANINVLPKNYKALGNGT